MKFKIAYLTTLISCLSFTSNSFADTMSEFNSLGSSKKIIERAKKLDPQNRYQILQKREVDRNYRFEVGVTGTMAFGGDSYVNTKAVGGDVHFHISPKFSVGFQYNQYGNTLTSEGVRVQDEALNDQQDSLNFNSIFLDFAQESYVGTVSWYPMYGKLNWLNVDTLQFDVYLMAGAGTIKLTQSGAVPTYVAGGGVGFWINNYITTRLEVKYQNYQEQNYINQRSIDLTTTTLSLGLLF